MRIAVPQRVQFMLELLAANEPEEYLRGTQFGQHVAAVLDSFVAVQSHLPMEQRATEKLGGARAEQLERAIRHTAQLYGGMQAMAGQAALQDIKTLRLDAPSGGPP